MSCKEVLYGSVGAKEGGVDVGQEARGGGQWGG